MSEDFKFPEDLLYQSPDVWVKNLGRGQYKIGITDYCQFKMDDIVSIILPEENKPVKKGETVIAIDSIDTNFSFPMPIGGIVVESNHQLNQDPELLNESPYVDGWICIIELEKTDELDDLLDVNEVYDEYQKEMVDEIEDDGFDSDYDDLEPSLDELDAFSNIEMDENEDDDFISW